MSLGWTTKDTFRTTRQTDPSQRDTFLTGLTQVYTTPVIRQNVKDSGGRWMRFPLTNTGFLYDSAQGLNLVVEMVLGPPFVKNYFCLMDSAGGTGAQMLSGYRDTPSVYATFRDPIVGSRQNMEFGFDITPVGVEAGGLIGGSFSVYPNPSRGAFTVSLDARQALRQAAITVHSATGALVWERRYNPASTSFETEISLPPGTAPGWYFVALVADGERVVQRVLVE